MTIPMTPERTFEVCDIDGVKRTVTLAQFRAEVDAAKAKAEAIFARDVAEYSASRR
jgi:hypothetical protein